MYYFPVNHIGENRSAPGEWLGLFALGPLGSAFSGPVALLRSRTPKAVSP